MLGLGAQRRRAASRRSRGPLADRRRQPAPGARTPAGAGAGHPALAQPARAARRQSGLDLHDPASARRVRAVRRRAAATTTWARPRAVRGLGQRRRAAARPGRAGQDAVDGHARQRPGLARSSSSTRWPPWPEERAFEMPFPPHGEQRLLPRRRRRHRGGDPLALRAARRAGRPRRPPTPVLDAMFSRDEPRTGTDGTLAWTVDVDNPATGDDFALTLKEISCPRCRRRRRRTRPCALWLLGQLPARARRPGASAVARHARARPGLDRHEAAQAAQLRRAAGPLHGVRARMPTASSASRSGPRPWPTWRGW